MNIKLDELGVLFAGAWNRFRERFAVAMEIIIAPIVLILISQLLLVHRTGAASVLGAIIECIAFILLIFASLAMISAFGNETDLSGSYAASFKLFWSWVWVYIIMELAIMGGFVMLIVPGIMLAVQLAFTSYAVVLDGKRGMAALARSREYVKGYWWAFAGRMLLLVLFLLVAMLILFLPAKLLGGYDFGQLVYSILLLIFIPFSVAYQYEIYGNLRRLKPELVEGVTATGEATPKTDSGFLKVSIVVGIVGAVVLFVLAVAGAFFLPTYFSRWNNQHPPAYNGGYGYPPTMMGTSTMPGEGMVIQVSPASGPIGTTVTISGGEFAATNTILMRGLVAARDVAPSADGTLSFAVPGTLAPNCAPNQACPQFLLEVTAGDYAVTIMNADGTMPVGTFTVTGAPLAPGTPSADGSD